MRVAVEGCCHGELDRIYAAVAERERREGRQVDLVIISGDFQAVRNPRDFSGMSVPAKFRKLNTFYKYYSGEAVAPYLTLCIGGNHEASDYMQELFYGGWLAPRIYYLGAAGVVRFGGLRIAGLSGIYNEHHYRLGHYERPPLSGGEVKSVYHVRQLQVYRLLQIHEPVDFFLSHDWPRGVANTPYCDREGLLRKKPYFRKEVERDELGSPAGALLMQELKPTRWFCAHLHCRFEATVVHGQQGSRSSLAARPGAPQVPPQGPRTHFLALDKVLPGRHFLEFVDVPDVPGAPKEFCYDAEWLAIMRSFHGIVSTTRAPVNLPGGGSLRTGPSAEDRQWVEQRLLARGGATIPANFVVTAPPHAMPGVQRGVGCGPCGVPHASAAAINPQTMELMNLLELPYNLHPAQPPRRPPQFNPPQPPRQWTNPEEIDLDGDSPAPRRTDPSSNPEEIDLGEELEDEPAPPCPINHETEQSPADDTPPAVMQAEAVTGVRGGDGKPEAKRVKLSLPPPRKV